MVIFILHPASAIAILIAGGVLFVLRKKTSFWSCFALGWFWQVLLTLPAGIWQGFAGWPHVSVSGSSIWSH
ncbi:MAG: hypothetical protein JXA81_05585, partial [Sedimentisphaerales bacterium]|nr:hypothetical protein [Sedimentisphaerales bacterium]